MTFISTIWSIFESCGFGVSSLTSIALVVCAVVIYRSMKNEKTPTNLPPVMPFRIPLLGHIGVLLKVFTDPHGFIFDGYKKYGQCFSISLLGRNITYLVGNEATRTVFSAKYEELDSAIIWDRVATPMFGKNIMFNVPPNVFVEHKKLVKTGQRLREYVPIVQKEAEVYFEKLWGNSGETEMCRTLQNLIVYCIAHCMNGVEVRDTLNDHTIKWIQELERGFSVQALVFPGWFPLPNIRARDRAHVELLRIYKAAIEKRRRDPNPPDDMIQNLINADLRSGEKLNDEQIAGSCMALQVGGRHSTAISTSWLLFQLAKHKKYQTAVYEEQKRIVGDEKNFTYDHISAMEMLDCCFKESLRIRPPVRMILRQTMTEKNVCGYTIPKGHWVWIDPFVNGQLPENWPDADIFKPERFLDPQLGVKQRFAYIPFSGGVHKCIGEAFAFIMIKTIMSHLIRTYEFDLVDNKFPDISYSSVADVPINALLKFKRRQPAV